MSDKILSILIPYHNEDENLFRPLLSSLNDQIGINFNDIEIIISNNVEKHLIKDLEYLFMEYSNIYPQIKYIECPYKSSMGPNRQNAFDHATGKWAMYCDFDDVLYSPTSLNTVLCSLEDDYDVYDFIALTEYAPYDPHYQEGLRFEVNEYNQVLLHGKIYKIEYLQKYNIRFCHKLYAWEDMYYNQLIDIYSPKRKYCPISIYIWKHRPTSVSNSEGTAWDYQCKHWKDSTSKYFYLIEHYLYHNPNLPEAHYYTLLAGSFYGWYMTDFDYNMNPKEVTRLRGAILKYFDPELKLLNYIHNTEISNHYGGLSFNEFCHFLIQKTPDADAILKEYNIGHFNDIPE